MVEAVARVRPSDEAEVRAAAHQPVPPDGRAIRVLRQAGFPVDGLAPRIVTVADLAWADLVITVTGEREDWDRFIPRSTPREHELLPDPLKLSSRSDDLEPFRITLRAVERLVAARLNRRSSAGPNVLPVRR